MPAGTLQKNGLKVTPQRVAVLEAINSSDNHPAADEIIDFISRHHPNIGKGTVYRVLETLVNRGIISRVKTDSGIMRYDPITARHHHLYCSNSERIEDYDDKELNIILDNYFRKKKIKGFMIEDIKLQLIGKFTETRRSKNHKKGQIRNNLK
ncbi:MAG: transcriptional repressor [Bacteroidetes bacterium]|nr:transcriptional repressor [Bacteroidota bacterium]